MTAVQEEQRLDWFDMALVVVFLLGIYSAYTIQITPKVPFPSAPSGLAGIVMLWRRRGVITPLAFGAFVAVIFCYTLSILTAPELVYLGRRLNGLIQLTYSLVIGYALFLTVSRAGRRQVAGLFLAFCLVIVVGCFLEDYTGFRAVSDAVRRVIYSSGVYDADLRDQLLYGRVRPKLFASEPSAVTFAYVLFAYVWLMASEARWKLVGYLALMGVGIFVMPGPTLLLMLVLLVPYELWVAGRTPQRPNGVDLGRLLRMALFGAFAAAVFIVLVSSVFSARLREITSGGDPSFFYRVLGPWIAAKDVVGHYPFTGSGLTGEPFIAGEVVDAYVRSPAYSPLWEIINPNRELVVNYFWQHWIYLGLGWGTVVLVALSAWLRILGTPSLLFCWVSWAILGQASGAYVGPKTWAVLFLAAAGAILHQRQSTPRLVAPAPVPVFFSSLLHGPAGRRLIG